MIGGFVTTVTWLLFYKEGFYNLYEMLPGFAAGFLCTIGVSLITEVPEGAAEELDAVKEALGPVFRSPSRSQPFIDPADPEPIPFDDFHQSWNA